MDLVSLRQKVRPVQNLSWGLALAPLFEVPPPLPSTSQNPAPLPTEEELRQEKITKDREKLKENKEKSALLRRKIASRKQEIALQEQKITSLQQNIQDRQKKLNKTPANPQEGEANAMRVKEEKFDFKYVTWIEGRLKNDVKKKYYMKFYKDPDFAERELKAFQCAKVKCFKLKEKDDYITEVYVPNLKLFREVTREIRTSDEVLKIGEKVVEYFMCLKKNNLYFVDFISIFFQDKTPVFRGEIFMLKDKKEIINKLKEYTYFWKKDMEKKKWENVVEAFQCYEIFALLENLLAKVTFNSSNKIVELREKFEGDKFNFKLEQISELMKLLRKNDSEGEEQEQGQEITAATDEFIQRIFGDKEERRKTVIDTISKRLGEKLKKKKKSEFDEKDEAKNIKNFLEEENFKAENQSLHDEFIRIMKKAKEFEKLWEKRREESQKRKAEREAKREAEEKARKAAEEKREAEDKARKAAEEKARREAEEKARREAEEKARREAEEKARIEAEKAKKAAEAKKSAEKRKAFRARKAAKAKRIEAWKKFLEKIGGNQKIMDKLRKYSKDLWKLYRNKLMYNGNLWEIFEEDYQKLILELKLDPEKPKKNRLKLLRHSKTTHPDKGGKPEEQQNINVLNNILQILKSSRYQDTNLVRLRF